MSSDANQDIYEALLKRYKTAGYLNPEAALNWDITVLMNKGKTREEAIQHLYNPPPKPAVTETDTGPAAEARTADSTDKSDRSTTVFSYRVRTHYKSKEPSLNALFDLLLQSGKEYATAKDGGIVFSFCGLPVHVLAVDSGKLDVSLYGTRVEGMPPWLGVKFPLTDRLRDVFWDWYEGMLWSQLSIGEFNDSALSGQNIYALFTRAQIPAGLVTRYTLTHALIEVTLGYWTLLKMLSDSGHLKFLVVEASQKSLKIHEKDIAELTKGSLAIKPYGPEETQSLVKSLSQENAQLMFVDRSEPPPKDLPKIPGIQSMWGGSVFLRPFKSEDLKELILPYREALTRLESDPLLVTVCQGFAATKFNQKVMFCALRFSVRVGDLSDFTSEQVQRWRESQIFLTMPTLPCKWIAAKTGGGIILHVNLPIYTENQHIIKHDYHLDDIKKDSVSNDFLRNISLWDQYLKSFFSHN